MRWGQLGKRLDETTAGALATLLDLPADRLALVWDELRLGRSYKTFTVGEPKPRLIHLPSEPLAEIQRRILHRILYSGAVSPAAYGGVPGRSVVDAARVHLEGGAGEVLRVDITNAYGSTAYRMVTRSLRSRLNQELWMLGLDRPEATRVVGVLADLITVRLGKGPGRRLPLGTPTSLAAFNLVCLDLDSELIRMTSGGWKDGPIAYTRYVDDMVFSRRGQLPSGLEDLVSALVRRFGYELNPKKTVRAPLPTAEVYGFQAGPWGPEPSSRARDRYAVQIRHHAARLADPEMPPREQEISRRTLTRIDHFLRRFFESVGRPRPPELVVSLQPAEAPSPLEHFDLLWP